MSTFKHPRSPENSPQVRTLSGSSAQSSAFGTTTKTVRVVSDTDCWIAFGASPTATTSSLYLPAKFPQVFGVVGGQKLAAIGTSGNLYISESDGV